MIIKCWGSRGSISVSGQEYNKYGGDTTCLEIRTQSDDIIIVDAGTGIRRLGNQLLKEGRHHFHFIFTHAHWDHIIGIPFFKPLYDPQIHLQMHQGPFDRFYIQKILTRVMDPPYHPVPYAKSQAHIENKENHRDKFEIGSVTIEPIPLSHPNGGSGYKITEAGKTFVFLTDNELGYVHPGGLSVDEYIKFSAGADLLIHDGEYTPEEYEKLTRFGHSDYSDVLDLAHKAEVKHLGLFHINQDRTDDAMDAIIDACRKTIEAQKYQYQVTAVGADMTFQL